VLVGGAALSNRFTRIKIAPEYEGLVVYANDAMKGLDLANQIMDYERRDSLKRMLAAESKRLVEAAPKSANGAAPQAVRARAVAAAVEIPAPPDFKAHVLSNYDLDEIFHYINPVMLYTRHLGFKNFEQALASGDARAQELRAAVQAVEETMLARKDITAGALYKFFPAQSDGERSVMILSPDGREVLETFTFGRQSDEPGLCLADYVAPRGSGRMDYLCMFVTTVGDGIRALAEEWKNRGDYLRSHILQVLALEGAEAFAELLHQKIRQMWGIEERRQVSMKELFQARYRGKRFSFG